MSLIPLFALNNGAFEAAVMGKHCPWLKVSLHLRKPGPHMLLEDTQGQPVLKCKLNLVMTVIICDEFQMEANILTCDPPGG